MSSDQSIQRFSAGILRGEIPWDSKWGQVLLPMVSQLMPELAAAPPLPHGVYQVGAVLALIAQEVETRATPDLTRFPESLVTDWGYRFQTGAAGALGS